MPTVFTSHPGASESTGVNPSVYPSSTVHLLSSFVPNPKGLRFETQQHEESVVLFVRQHIIVMLPWILTAIAMVVAPIFLFPLISAMALHSISIPMGYTIVGTLFWYVATCGFVIVKFLRWYFNIYIVTNERIVDVDFLNLLYKRFSQAELDRIENVTYSSGGIVATFFHYGNVYVETAGATPNIEFENIPNPDRIVEIIRLAAQNRGKKLT